MSSVRIRAGIGGAAAAVLALMAFGSTASAKTINVPGDRPTIQGAVNAADPGDKILVEARKRRYFENVNVNTNRLRIVGDPKRGQLPIVDGTSRVNDIDDLVFDINADHVKLRRLALRNGNGTDCDGLGCEFEAVNVRMSDQGGDCIEIDGNQGRVERSTFRGCDDNAFDFDGNGAKAIGNQIHQVDNDCGIVQGNRARVHRNRAINCEDSEAFDVDGHNSEITRNLAKSSDSNGFEVNGNGNLIANNRAVNIEDDCYDIDGRNPRVVDNRAKACDGAFEVDGENMRVRDNRGTLVGDDSGFDVNCSDRAGGAAPAGVCRKAVIEGNFASDNNNDDEGFEISDFTGDGGLLIRNNVSEDNNDGGFEIDVDRSRIAHNVSRRDGAEGNEPGIEVDGVRNAVVGNRAFASGEHGLEVGDNRNRIRRNVSRLANVDGINVDFGTGNTLRQNRAVNNNGEGIENDGDDTRVIRNVASRNRVDCANDGTIAVKRRNRCADGSNFNQPGGLDRPLRRG